MRRLPGGKTGLKTGLLLNSFIIIFAIFSSPSFCQIPINGFCSQKNFDIPKGYSSILSADLNASEGEELLLYSNTTRKIGLVSGIFDKNELFTEYPINFEISQLRKLKGFNPGQTVFSVVERKRRKVFVIEMTSNFDISVISEIEFDSYPENIFSGDINSDGKDEILVSGSGFDGLSILTIAESGIGEKKITTGSSFTDAVIFDYNDDGYKDIVAFDILENSLQFFMNNTNGIFRSTRKITYPEKISFLRIADFNRDGLNDLVYSFNKKIEIIYGDYQGIFKDKVSIKLDEKPTGIVVGDFNSDKAQDIAYSLPNGTVNFLFSKDIQNFYVSVTYTRCDSVAAISKFKSGGKDNLAILNKSGILKIISSVNSLEDSLNIVPAIKAAALKKFDYGKDNIPDICFIDEYDSFLKVLISNNEGVPTKLYYFPVVENYKEILVGDFYHQIKTFYCYTEGIPLIEVFNYDFNTEKLNRKQLYAPGEILDVNLQRVDSSLVNVFLIYNKQSKLHLGKFENRGQSITFREYPFIDRNVTTAKIRIKEEPEIFYWKTERDTLYFYLAEIEAGPNILKTYFKVPNSDDLVINLCGANFYNMNYPTVVSIVQNKNENHILLFAGESFKESSPVISNNTQEIRQFGRGFFGEISTKGIINFTINSIDDDYIYSLIYGEKEDRYLLKPAVYVDNVNDYLFLKLEQKNYLFYSNTIGEILTFLIKK